MDNLLSILKCVQRCYICLFLLTCFLSLSHFSLFKKNYFSIVKLNRLSSKNILEVIEIWKVKNIHFYYLEMTTVNHVMYLSLLAVCVFLCNIFLVCLF